MTISMESVASNPELAKVYPLSMISPSARNFLDSTFVNVESLRDTEGEARLDIHPDDAAMCGIDDGDMVRIFSLTDIGNAPTFNDVLAQVEKAEAGHEDEVAGSDIVRHGSIDGRLLAAGVFRASRTRTVRAAVGGKADRRLAIQSRD